MIFTDKSLSPAEIIRILGQRFREYRMSMDLTRKQVAEQTCLSMTTLYKLETGNLYDISFSTMLKLMRVLGLYENWNKLLPEMPESPYLYKSNFNKKQRIRNSKPKP